MKKIFAIQVKIVIFNMWIFVILHIIQILIFDLEDWEFKVPTLFASLYSAQDEISMIIIGLFKLID